MLTIYYRPHFFPKSGARAWTNSMAEVGQFVSISQEELETLTKLATYGLFKMELKGDDE